MLWRDVFPFKTSCRGGSIVSLLSAVEQAVQEKFNKKIATNRQLLITVKVKKFVKWHRTQQDLNAPEF